MALTVTAAFREFLRDSVNLNPDRVDEARKSRNWLLDRIRELPSKDDWFPNLYTEKDIFYGSFARKTKKRPLDDVDLMVCMMGEGGTYLETVEDIRVTAGDNSRKLKALCFDDGITVNSRRVLNKFVSSLSKIPQYKSAEIKRNNVAVTLNLTSYEWTFDIIPCFFTTEDIYGKNYYLIPDGNGHWQKTDPRKDRDRVNASNQRHDGHILKVIRTLKYWNRRATMPSMQSYLIENMILDYYDGLYFGGTSEHVDIEIPRVLAHIRDKVYYPVIDPKGIQGDINHLTPDEKSRIWDRANLDYNKASEARRLEGNGEEKASINKWREVFGSEFPVYD